jgi:hypothetical protein
MVMTQAEIELRVLWVAVLKSWNTPITKSGFAIRQYMTELLERIKDEKATGTPASD